MKMLDGKRVAILVTNGFEQKELVETREALEAAGAQVQVVSPKKERVQGFINQEWGDMVAVERHISEARVEDYDALLLPGGVMNPDFLRLDPRAVSFVRNFVASGKPVAAMGHAAWVLIEADVVRGRRLTSYRSLRSDLRNAGARWVDQEVVVDGNLVTSRWPDDLPAFERAIIATVAGSQTPQSRPQGAPAL
jgi:protease I